MSTRNREKRAAKQKKRRRAANERARPKFDIPIDGLLLPEMLVWAIRNAAMCPEHDAKHHAAELLEDFPISALDFDLAAEIAMADAVRAAWEAGWLPSDLHEFSRRNLEAPAAKYLTEAIILECKRYPASTLHPRWRTDLTGISSGIDTHAAEPQMRRWAMANGVDQRAALTIVLHVLALLNTLPVLEPLLPLPGAIQHTTIALDEVDERALGKVRALLAKAEATDFPEEAEALSAKAQELMSGQTRTRSYRHAFLVAYATRIGERLDAINLTVTAEAEDSRLLPVLSANLRAADELTGRLFPEMVDRRVSVSNDAGWFAGRAAADLAHVEVNGSIAG